MRKWFVGMVVGVWAMLVLLGCQGQAPAPTTAVSGTPAVIDEVCGDRSRLASTLHFYNWSLYMDDDILASFKEKCGVKVVQDTFASNEDLLAKLQAGASGYDLIVPSDYMVTIMRELDLLAPIDYANIPNFANIDDRFKKPPFDPEQQYTVPYQWGTSGIAYNTKKVTEPIESWQAIFDPARACQYQGLSLLNDPREVFGAALKWKGYSLNDTDPAHLAEAQQAVRAIKKCVTTFDSESFADILLNGEVAVGHGWSGQYAKAIEENPDLTYVVPEEGSVIWVDNLAIPKSAPNPYTAEVFINYLLRPDIGAQLTNYTFYASPNAAARPLINPNISGNPSIFPPPEVMDKLEFLRDVGEATPLIEQMWTEVKSQ